jgi:hypothetical protein
MTEELVRGKEGKLVSFHVGPRYHTLKAIGAGSYGLVWCVINGIYRAL